MSQYIFDTDHLSWFVRGHPKVTARLQQLPPGSVVLTVITVEEQLRGRLGQIRAASSETSFIHACQWLRETIETISSFRILDYNDSPSRHFASLRKQKLRIGTMDLRIAAITLSVNGILVTRDAVHFSQVPGLTIEDWTK